MNMQRVWIEATRNSIAHWNRMIEYVEGYSHDEWISFDSLRLDLSEGPGSNDCDLCMVSKKQSSSSYMCLACPYGIYVGVCVHSVHNKFKIPLNAYINIDDMDRKPVFLDAAIAVRDELEYVLMKLCSSQGGWYE